MSDPKLSPAEQLAVLTVTGHKEIPKQYRDMPFDDVLKTLRKNKLDGDAVDMLRLRDDIDQIVDDVKSQHQATFDDFKLTAQELEDFKAMVKRLVIRVLSAGAFWDVRAMLEFKDIQREMELYK